MQIHLYSLRLIDFLPYLCRHETMDDDWDADCLGGWYAGVN